ncbi:uncharacterized protein V6R79_002604 [Siganus canaliculatus]
MSRTPRPDIWHEDKKDTACGAAALLRHGPAQYSTTNHFNHITSAGDYYTTRLQTAATSSSRMLQQLQAAEHAPKWQLPVQRFLSQHEERSPEGEQCFFM